MTQTVVDLKTLLKDSTDVIAIFQLKFDRTTEMIRWLSTSQMRSMKKKIRLGNYELKYVAPAAEYGRLDDRGTLLENVFTVFNVSRPEDFRGHSLSVSDIVALKDSEGTIYYYVDDFGFKQLQDIA